MRRRAVLAATLALAGCGLSERPYAEKRQWPLAASRPHALPPRTRGRVLLVRNIDAAPGLGARGLQSILPDGSLQIDFYEEWAVPPAQSVESELRRWLGASGLFAAVLAPGSRVPADLVLEGALTRFVADPGAGVARGAMTLVLIDQRPNPVRVLLQQQITAEERLPQPGPAGSVAALRAVLADMLVQAEAALARFA